ncbi:MAG: hypothetical protein HYU88_04310 [Chloroflexi bacterium]|nr:hypothetical protein [Chloroflexota bacterium]MBI4506335.1 hypothetical protein [Chloroflexota bacterium]
MSQKDYEPDDPMALRGVGLPAGSADAMAACLVEEYVRLGYSDQQLLRLFRSPAFAATHALYRGRGEAWLHGLIGQARDQWSQPRFVVRRGRDGDTA